MGKLLVHITHGPESPTRAALGLLVARAAIDEGHEVSVFLAGDAVQLVRPSVLAALTGLGTGSLGESFEAVAAGGGRFYVSGKSSQARRRRGGPCEPACGVRDAEQARRADFRGRQGAHVLTAACGPTRSLPLPQAPDRVPHPPRRRDGSQRWLG